MSKRAPYLIAVAVATATVGTAWGAEGDVSVDMKPSGHSVSAEGTPPTFRATVNTSADVSSVFLVVSKTKEMRKDLGGIIDNKNKVWMTAMRHSGKRWKITPERHQFKRYWLNNAGTYYWQAFYINCAPNQERGACYHASAVQKVTVTG